MNACIARIVLAGLCVLGACVLGLWHLLQGDSAHAFSWFVGLAYLGAFIAPNADDTTALYRDFTAKGE